MLMRTFPFHIFYNQDPPAGGGGGGGTGGAGGTGGGGAPQTVPYDRFQTVVSEKNALVTERDSLKAEIQKLTEKAATADTLAAEVTRWKGEVETHKGRFQTFTELSGALGTTDTDVIDIFDARYQALPQKDRPTRTAWVEGLKTKPDEAPTVLRPWLALAQGDGGKGGAKPPQPKPPGTPPTPPGAGGNVTAEAIRAAREKGTKTGDWSEYKRLMGRDKK